jgi:hypothetical protein
MAVRLPHVPVGAALRLGGAYGGSVPPRVGGLAAVAALASGAGTPGITVPPGSPRQRGGGVVGAAAGAADAIPVVVKQEEPQYDEDEQMPEVGGPGLHEGPALWVWGEGAVSGGGADLLAQPGPGLPPLDR